MARQLWCQGTAPRTWRLQPLFPLESASPSEQWSAAAVADGDGGDGGQIGVGTRLFITATCISEIVTGGAATTAVLVPVIQPTGPATPRTGLVIPAIVLVTRDTFALPLLLRELGHPILWLVLPSVTSLDLLPIPLGKARVIAR